MELAPFVRSILKLWTRLNVSQQVKIRILKSPERLKMKASGQQPSMKVVETLSYKKEITSDSRKRHQDFLKVQGDAGKLEQAGKFMDESGALVIWNVDSLSTAERLVREDPYVSDGIADFVLKEWLVSFNFTPRT